MGDPMTGLIVGRNCLHEPNQRYFVWHKKATRGHRKISMPRLSWSSLHSSGERHRPNRWQAATAGATHSRHRRMRPFGASSTRGRQLPWRIPRRVPPGKRTGKSRRRCGLGTPMQPSSLARPQTSLSLVRGSNDHGLNLVSMQSMPSGHISQFLWLVTGYCTH